MMMLIKGINSIQLMYNLMFYISNKYFFLTIQEQYPAHGMPDPLSSKSSKVDGDESFPGDVGDGGAGEDVGGVLAAVVGAPPAPRRAQVQPRHRAGVVAYRTHRLKCTV